MQTLCTLTHNNNFYTVGFENTVIAGRDDDYLGSAIFYWNGATWSTIAYRYIGLSYTLEYQYMSYAASSIKLFVMVCLSLEPDNTG